ncbi:MAG TPA: agmatine deiminase [Planctomycetaceae bacterium]|nr:agmatine deiminase [Planctomycetaceae bacterium]
MNDLKSPFRWPAEWESQAATWIAWPHNRETWPGHYDDIPSVFETLVTALSNCQPVHIIAAAGAVYEDATTRLGHCPNVFIHSIATNDCWIRDYGPTFVQRLDDRSLVGVLWHFNAWGDKYPPYDLDDAAAEKICRHLGAPFNQSSLYCEGGALEGNGDGLLLTTSSCLLSTTRNAGWKREMVEEELRLQLGVKQVVWVDGGGLVGDDTDGHIDQLARFVAPTVVVAATSHDSTDPNAPGLQKNVELLRSTRTLDGGLLAVHELPTPPPRWVDGQRVPESYCNFIFAEGSVIVPTFRAATDQYALDLLARLLPNRRVVPLDAYDLIWGLGAFHCVTQNQPA